MAIKTMYAIGPMKYGTRRLQAGDPVEMDAAHQHLYTALGKVTAEKPRPVRAMTAKVVEEEAPKPKAAPRKRTRKAKK
jgi:hypothetical protein